MGDGGHVSVGPGMNGECLRTSNRGWLLALGALAAVRAAVALAALAASGEQLPGLPRYTFVALPGDATGYYAATREFMAAWGRLPVAAVALLALATVAGAVVLVREWRRRRERRAWLVVCAAAGASLLATVAVTQMNASGAPVFGWPLVWALPMLPYRALGGPLDPEVAFGFGLTLSLAANAVTVVAIAYAGLYATGRRALGLLAAALFALWPFLTGLLGGSRAWENGTWQTDAGLHLYTEPLSTALVAVALALLLRAGAAPLVLALAGAALGFATVVKLSNGVLAALAALVLWRAVGVKRSAPYLAAGAAWVPLVVTFWPLGYETYDHLPDDLFALHHSGPSWTESLLWRPGVLLVVLPLAVLGALVLPRDRRLALLVAFTLANAVFYTPYYFTAQHPRFLFASLPSLFVLIAAGAGAVASAVRYRIGAGPQSGDEPPGTSRRRLSVHVSPETSPTSATQIPRASAQASERPSGDHVGLESFPLRAV